MMAMILLLYVTVDTSFMIDRRDIKLTDLQVGAAAMASSTVGLPSTMSIVRDQVLEGFTVSHHFSLSIAVVQPTHRHRQSPPKHGSEISLQPKLPLITGCLSLFLQLKPPLMALFYSATQDNVKL
ncbi:hypothetical protein F0562_025693 [Nyssa sinensis]|uniref:Uncharacterized protein n=1 Tax=Nyssa sinensis TaxID=561372 RepID=A0A5J5BCR7_9ASTE|nr:hypothetical protein F0562_025693 [Nyssa sinensis]